MSEHRTLPYPTTPSTSWAMQIFVIIALIGVISYFHCILHGLQDIFASTPPILTSQKMIPAPISEGIGAQRGKAICIRWHS